MIWLKLTVLAVLASLCDSVAVKSSESYLVYALDKRGTRTFFLTDLNLNIQKRMVELESAALDKMYLNRDEHGLNLYWSYKDSPTIGRYEVSTGRKETRKLSNENTVFLGVGYNEQIYLYSPTSKNISVYEYDSAKKLLELSGLEKSDTDMHCVDVDPRDREQIFFAECSDNKYTGRVYDISAKEILKDYEQDLPYCFDSWRITPNGQRAYAPRRNEVFMSPHEGAPFTIIYKATEDIVGFAAGNNEFFFSNKEKYQTSKIFKATPLPSKGFQLSEVKVEGAVKLMALYTPPTRYLVYAVENGNFLKFIKTDLEFHKSQTLHEVDTKGRLLDKMYSGYNKGGHVIYWSYKNSNILGLIRVKNGQNSQKHLKHNFGKLIGAGNDDKMYFYHSRSKIFYVYNFRTNQKELELKVPTVTDMHCTDVDPRNRDQVFFAECTKNGNFGKVLDIKEKKVLEDYNQELPVCFDTWSITPNGKKAYAVHKNLIYLSLKEGAPFDEYTWTDDNIVTFASGNNELFYTTKDTGKIFKLTSGNNKGEFFTSEFDAPGNVKALVLYQE